MEQEPKPNESATVAVLYERVNNLVEQGKALRNDMSQLKEIAGDMGTVKAMITAFGEKLDMLLDVQSDQKKELDQHASKLAEHATIWKIAGTGVILSLSVVGWAFASLMDLRQYDRQLDRRLLCIELRLNDGHEKALPPNKVKIVGGDDEKP